MNLGTCVQSEIVFLIPGLNSNVSFCVVKKPSHFKNPSSWTLPLRTPEGGPNAGGGEQAETENLS